jgi:hypothetical protein
MICHYFSVLESAIGKTVFCKIDKGVIGKSKEHGGTKVRFTVTSKKGLQPWVINFHHQASTILLPLRHFKK